MLAIRHSEFRSTWRIAGLATTGSLNLCPNSSSLWLSDEAKIETEQEEDEMDDGAPAADLRCLDKTCPQQMHRNIGEIAIEQNAR